MPNTLSEDYLKTTCRNCNKEKPNLNTHTIFVFLTACFTDSIIPSQGRAFSRCSAQFPRQALRRNWIAFQSPSSRAGRCSGSAPGTMSTLSLSIFSTRVKKDVKNDVGIRHFSLVSLITSLKTAMFCEMRKFSTGLLTEKGWDPIITSYKSTKTRRLSDIPLLYGYTPICKNN